MLIFNLRKMANLLYDEWDLAKEKSKSKGKTCAYIYLFEILNESEKIVIKKENNKLVGFAGYSIWNSKEHIIRKTFYGLLAKLLINGLLVKNKQAIYDYNEAYDGIPSDLEDYFDAELSILIVDKNYRGKGYGKALLDNIKNMQILTDEFCNYHFYELMGCKKIKEVKIPVGEPGRTKEENYVY